MITTTSLLLAVTVSATSSIELWEFTADWCGGCRQMQPIVERLHQEGVPVRVINVDDQPELARRFSVHSIPCFVVVSDGRALERIEGPVSYDRLVHLLHRAPTASAAAAAPPVIRGQSQGGFARQPRGRDPSALAGRGGLPSPSRATAGYDLPRPQLSPLPTAPGHASAAVLNAVVENNSQPSRVAVGSPTQRALAATVRIRIEDQRGQSVGTGTIIDVHQNEALVLTCGHIFRDSAGQGKIFCDFFFPGASAKVPAKLISYNLRRDVGLISAPVNVPVTPTKVGGAGYRPDVNDNVFSLGCNRGADPTINSNRILAVNRYHGPANLVVGGRPVDGRSGGGLFSQDGALIGVCNAADQECDEGLYAALGPIHAELDSVGLGFVYRGEQKPLARALSQAAAPAAGRVLPRAAPAPTSPAAAQGAVPVANIGTRETEVICIVRSRSQPDGAGQAFVLEHPSSELLSQLTLELNKRGPHVTTDWNGGNGSVTPQAVQPGRNPAGAWRHDPATYPR